MYRYRGHPLWAAFLLGKFSRLALALFLPVHFFGGLRLLPPELLP